MIYEVQKTYYSKNRQKDLPHHSRQDEEDQRITQDYERGHQIMIVKLYSVRDKLIGFNPPIGFKDDKVAIRWFEAFCKQKKEQEFTEAKYYDLYCVGSFDTEKAELVGTAVHQIELVREGESLNE